MNQEKIYFYGAMIYEGVLSMYVTHYETRERYTLELDSTEVPAARATIRTRKRNKMSQPIYLGLYNEIALEIRYALQKIMGETKFDTKMLAEDDYRMSTRSRTILNEWKCLKSRKQIKNPVKNSKGNLNTHLVLQNKMIMKEAEELLQHYAKTAAIDAALDERNEELFYQLVRG